MAEEDGMEDHRCLRDRLLDYFSLEYLDGFTIENIPGRPDLDTALTVAAMKMKFEDSNCGLRLLHSAIVHLERQVYRRRGKKDDQETGDRGKECLSFVSLFGGPVIGKTVTFRFAAVRSGAVLIHIPLRLPEAFLHCTVIEQVEKGLFSCFPIPIKAYKAVLREAFSIANVELFMLEEIRRKKQQARSVFRKLDFGRSEVHVDDDDQVPLVEDDDQVPLLEDEDDDSVGAHFGEGMKHLRGWRKSQPHYYITGKSPQRIDGRDLSDDENPRYVDFCERIRTPLVNWGILKAKRVDDYSLRRVLQLAILALFDSFWNSQKPTSPDPEGAGQAYLLMSGLATACRAFCAEIFPDDIVMYCVDDGEKIIFNKPKKEEEGNVEHEEREDYLVVGTFDTMKDQSHKTVLCLGSTRGNSGILSGGSGYHEVRGCPSIDLTCSAGFCRHALENMLEGTFLDRCARLLVPGLAGPPIMLAIFAESCLKQILASHEKSSVLDAYGMLSVAVKAAQDCLVTWRPTNEIVERLVEGRTAEEFKWILELGRSAETETWPESLDAEPERVLSTRDVNVPVVALLSEYRGVEVLPTVTVLEYCRVLPAHEFTLDRKKLCEDMGINFEDFVSPPTAANPEPSNDIRIICPHHGILHRAKCAIQQIEENEAKRKKDEGEDEGEAGESRSSTSATASSQSSASAPPETSTNRAATARVSMSPIGEKGNRYVTFVVQNDYDEVQESEEQQEGGRKRRTEQFSFRLLKDYVRAYRRLVQSTCVCYIASRTCYSILARANMAGALVKIFDRIFTRAFDDMGSDYDVLFEDFLTIDEDRVSFVGAFGELVEEMGFGRLLVIRYCSSETAMLRGVRRGVVKWYADTIYSCSDVGSAIRCCRALLEKVFTGERGTISLRELGRVVFRRIPLIAAQVIMVDALIRTLLGSESARASVGYRALHNLRPPESEDSPAWEALEASKAHAAFLIALGVHSCLFDLEGLFPLLSSEISIKRQHSRFLLWEIEENICLYRLCPTCLPPLRESQERLDRLFRTILPGKPSVNLFSVLSWRDGILCSEDFDMRVAEPVATGTYGRVVQYRPSSGGSSCSVALKLPNVLRTAKNCFGELLKEVAFTKRFAHPNIVKCYGWMYDPIGQRRRYEYVGEEKKKPKIFSHRLYFVYEWCHGGTLEEWAIRNSQEPGYSISLLRVLLGVARALACCHQEEVVHLDVKMNNVVMTSPGLDAIPKLIDFGFAWETTEPHRHPLERRWTGEWYCPSDFVEVAGTQSRTLKPGVELMMIDVYGFGHLLESVTETSRPSLAIKEALELIAENCKLVNFGARPRIERIVADMQALLGRE